MCRRLLNNVTAPEGDTPMLRTILGATAALGIALHAWAQIQTTESHGAATQETVAAAEEGGPRRWQVTARGGLQMHGAPAVDARVVETLAEGASLSNLGCERHGGRVWCAVQPLRRRARGYVAAEFLRPARGTDGTVLIGIDDSSLRASRGDFDASGYIPCAQIRGQPMGECAFGVARSSGGDATVAVTFPNGFKRKLFFTHGAFIRADSSMSGAGFDTDWRTEGDLHIIRVDDQRYELPDAAIFGD